MDRMTADGGLLLGLSYHLSSSAFDTKEAECLDTPLRRPTGRLKIKAPGVMTPTVIAAGWLSDVQARIRNSMASAEAFTDHSVDWLEPRVARNAAWFFDSYSDVLPGEPYIYRSPSGELVAEFTEWAGRLTAIIGASSELLFSQIGESIEQHDIGDEGERTVDSARRLLFALRDRLAGKSHGEEMAS